MLDKVKLALRISHAYLDSDIQSTIDTARAELIRLGVSKDMANNDDDPLIASAIKTYCLYVHSSDEKMKDGYLESWQYQFDCLRKSSGYSEVSEDV